MPFDNNMIQEPLGYVLRIANGLQVRYIQQNRKILYTNLLTRGKRNRCLADVNEQAEALFFRPVNQLAKKEGVTEKIKAHGRMEWVRRMNTTQACAEEIGLLFLKAIFSFMYLLTICGNKIIIKLLLRIGGDDLVARKKPGPNPEYPKDTMLRVRVDKNTLEKLDNSVKKLNSTRSEVIRQGIDLMDEKLRKK